MHWEPSEWSLCWAKTSCEMPAAAADAPECDLVQRTVGDVGRDAADVAAPDTVVRRIVAVIRWRTDLVADSHQPILNVPSGKNGIGDWHRYGARIPVGVHSHTGLVIVHIVARRHGRGRALNHAGLRQISESVIGKQNFSGLVAALTLIDRQNRSSFAQSSVAGDSGIEILTASDSCVPVQTTPKSRHRTRSSPMFGGGINPWSLTITNRAVFPSN